jgi:hypothetical protein
MGSKEAGSRQGLLWIGWWFLALTRACMVAISLDILYVLCLVCLDMICTLFKDEEMLCTAMESVCNFSSD